MTHRFATILTLSLLCTLGAACGDLAEPIDQPSTGQTDAVHLPAHVAVDTAVRVEPAAAVDDQSPQQADFEQGYAFDKATPAVESVQRGDGYENVRVLHLRADSSADDDEKTKDNPPRGGIDRVSDGNPVPFPVDRKNPFVD